MKLTCLSKGGGGGAGYHFPPSHVLELAGHRLLLECPLDFSPLTLFSPIPPSTQPQPNNLIRSIPRYKTLTALHLWDPSLIDAVLVSTPAGMLGLPFLVRDRKFGGKVYATEAAAKLGRLMMEEIVGMHDEFVRFYGPEEGDGLPEWMRWEEVEQMPAEVREVVLGENGEELGCWMPLYSETDVKKCVQSVQSLKYAEEVCFNGIIKLKAFSSGLEIGSCNWMITGPRGSIAYLSSSIFQSAHAMDFDYRSLRGNDIVLFSDMSSLNSIHSNKNIMAACDNEGEMENYLIDPKENSEEINKISFICSCIMDSLNDGGSVLIPIGRLDIVLKLLEEISQSLESSNLKVPIFMISSTAEETLAFTNVVPEWLCKQRQEKLFSGEAPFGHVELMREKKLNLFPLLYAPELLMTWEEPCIVFSPHWSLRLGPVVHLLHRWHTNHKCLLILEQGVDAEAALSPFETVAIKVLQCSFLSGIKADKILPLVHVLQPKLVLFPEDLRSLCPAPTNDDKNNPSFFFLYYSQNITVHIPKFRDNFETCLATDLAFQLHPRRLASKQNDMAIARLKRGRLLLSKGKYILVSSGEKPAADLPNKPARLYWGSLDPARLLSALQEKGINGSLVLSGDEEVASSDTDSMTCCTIHLHEQEDALIEMSATETVICCADESMVARICEAMNTVCNGI